MIQTTATLPPAPVARVRGVQRIKATGPRFGTIDGGVRPFLAANPEFKFMVAVERPGKDDATTYRTFFLFRNGDEFIREIVEPVGDLKYPWHEYVMPGAPVRLYFDIEDQLMRDDLPDLIRRVHECAIALKGEDAREIEVSDASTDDKLSKHVVFPDCWMRDSIELYAIANMIHAHLNRDCRIDMMPYTNTPTVFKCLRTLYSPSLKKRKRPAPGNVLPEDPPGYRRGRLVPDGEQSDAPLNVEKLKRSLITYGAPERIAGRELVPLLGDVMPGSFADDEDTNPDRRRGMERVKQWIEKYYGTRLKIMTSRGPELDRNTGRWTWHASPGVWCPFARARHNSNNCMVRGTFMDESNRVRIDVQCQDADCGKRWVEDRAFNWTVIAFPVESSLRE